jgi:predicted transcriptional regulator of viral defense system
MPVSEKKTTSRFASETPIASKVILFHVKKTHGIRKFNITLNLPIVYFISLFPYLCGKTETQMLYQELYKTMSGQACFTSNQVYAWHPGFDKNNMGRWVKKGLLVKLRNGYYTFPEYLDEPSFAFFLANRIYRPSYISLHTALAFHGLIPESVVQITSVTTLKTNKFQNRFGIFSYKTIKPQGLFGYDHLPFSQGRNLLMAKPEKALIDLLYLYTFYTTEEDLIGLRLDEDILKEIVNTELMQSFTVKFNNAALKMRVELLIGVYNL